MRIRIVRPCIVGGVLYQDEVIEVEYSWEILTLSATKHIEVVEEEEAEAPAEQTKQTRKRR